MMNHYRLLLTKKIIALLLFCLMPFSYADIEAINSATIEDQNTIAVFFKTPQTFTKEELQKQFVIHKAYDYVDDTRKERQKAESGKWHLSKDGYQLYYSPIPQGAYIVNALDFDTEFDTDYAADRYVYIGRSSEKISIVGRGPVIPLSQRSIPIDAIGVKEIDAEFHKIDNPVQFFESHYIASTLEAWTLDNLRSYLTPAGIFRYVLPPDADLNKKTRHQVPIDKNITAGAYILSLNSSGQFQKEIEPRIVIITDIGIHVRRYQDKTLILAHHFSDTSPVRFASVEIWSNKNRKLQINQETCTLADGFCLLNQAVNFDDIIVVKTDNDLSMLPMREVALDLNDFAITGETYNAQVAHIYSNRQLYRPAEPITLNVLLRDADGNRLPNQPLELRLIAPDGKVYRTNTLTSNETGFYQTQVTLESDVKSGFWNAEIHTNSESKIAIGKLGLHIEEFMPERMELQLKPQTTSLAANEAIFLAISSRYLFGAPAAGNALKIENQFSSNYRPFIKHRDWYVGKEHLDSSIVETNSEIDARLDQEGNHTIDIHLPITDSDKKPEQVVRAMVNVTVLDSGTSGIRRNFTADFWPTEIVPVIRPLFKPQDLGYGSKANFEIFAADKEGKTVPRNLKLTLKYRDNYCMWVYSDLNGWDCHRNENMQIKELKTLTNLSEVFEYSVDPDWGRYTLSLIDIDSGFETAYDFSSDWSEGGDGQLPAARPMALNLAFDKPSYKNGNKIVLKIDAPFSGTLTLMTEGDKPLTNKTIKVTKGINTVHLTVDKAWKRHDLYITAFLLGKDSLGQVVRALGITPLKLDRLERTMKINIDHGAVVEPEKPFAVKVKIDKSRKNSYATISVTDQGILNMTPTKPVNIFDAFFKQRKYGADIIDYYNRLFRKTSDALLTPKFGGDGEVTGGDNADMNLTEMKTVSITSPLLQFNNKGELTANFDLPEFNGEAKVLVKVFTDDAVSEEEKQVTIRAPIVADLVTPQFIRVGDESHVALSLHNLSGKKQAIKITLNSEAFNTQFNETYTLEDQASTSALIPVHLKGYTTQGRLSLEIQSDVYNATRDYRIGTVPLGVRVTKFERLFLEGAQNSWQKNRALQQNFEGAAAESIILSRYPIIDVLNFTDNLFRYPYGCTEQTISMAFPWLFPANEVLDIEKQNAYNKQLDEKSRSAMPLSFEAWKKEMMQTSIQRLLRRQNHEGGFGLWSDEHVNVSVTAYTADFLFQASRAYPDLVPTKALDNSVNYLKKEISAMAEFLRENNSARTRYNINSDHYYNLTNLSYAAWILAREGKLFSADLMVFADHVERISPLSRMYLAAANFIVGNERIAYALINQVKFDNWNSRYGYFYTDTTEIALSIDVINQLRARSLYKDSQPLQTELLQLLAKRIEKREYFSTQDRYALIKIGIDLPKDDKKITAMINNKRESLESGMPIDAKTIETVNSEENLFLEYKIEGHPVQALSMSTFSVELKKYTYIGVSPINVGERQLVTITVKPYRDINNALFVDYVPGGFILENPNMQLGGITPDEYFESFDSKLKRSPVVHEEFRFDRYVASLNMKAHKTYTFAYVVQAQIPGKYTLPVTELESMYMPMLRAVQSYTTQYEILSNSK